MKPLFTPFHRFSGQALALLWLVALAFAPGRAAAQQAQLAPVELTLAAPPVRVMTVHWKQKPYVMVLSPTQGNLEKNERPFQTLSLITLEGNSLKTAYNWKLPDLLRWIEPVKLPGGQEGWLALVADTWMVATADNGGLKWHTSCACKTVFSVGMSPLTLDAPLARDLDHNGVDEVMLPHWDGLVAYRFEPGGLALVPLWRDGWTAGERFIGDQDGLNAHFGFPRYAFGDFNGDKVDDLAFVGQNSLTVAYHPSAGVVRGGGHQANYSLEQGKKASLQRLGLPAPMLAALLRVGFKAFDSEQELMAALAKEGPGDWNAWRGKLSAIAKEATPVRFAQPVAIEGLSPLKRGETQSILGLRDMDGDGVADLLYRKSSDEGDPFNQRNQLRWYKGRLQGGQYGLAGSPQLYISEGISLTYLTEPETRPGAPPALFTATMEVNIAAIIKYFTVKTVSIDAFWVPWENGHLVNPPKVQGDISFKADFSRDATRPMMVWADLNGDGWREYIFNTGPEQVSAYEGGPKGPNFLRPMVQGTSELPRDKEFVYTADLNGDKKEELVLWFRSNAHSPQLQRTLRVLRWKTP